MLNDAELTVHETVATRKESRVRHSCLEIIYKLVSVYSHFLIYEWIFKRFVKSVNIINYLHYLNEQVNVYKLVKKIKKI